VETSESGNHALLEQLLGALSYLHSLGMVHRDVKPSNCFLKDDGNGSLSLRLGDFGLARDGSAASPNPSLASSLSSSSSAIIPPQMLPPAAAAASVGLPGMLMPNSSGPHSGRLGTRTYAAPEQETQPPAPYTPAADMYGVGIIMVEMFVVFSTRMERSKILSALRRHDLPVAFVARHPREAALASALLSQEPLHRPSAADALRRLEEARAAAAPVAQPLPGLLRRLDGNRLASSMPD
jgi:serine/threonine protein kinase